MQVRLETFLPHHWDGKKQVSQLLVAMVVRRLGGQDHGSLMTHGCRAGPGSLTLSELLHNLWTGLLPRYYNTEHCTAQIYGKVGQKEQINQ